MTSPERAWCGWNRPHLVGIAAGGMAAGVGVGGGLDVEHTATERVNRVADAGQRDDLQRFWQRRERAVAERGGGEDFAANARSAQNQPRREHHRQDARDENPRQRLRQMRRHVVFHLVRLGGGLVRVGGDAVEVVLGEQRANKGRIVAELIAVRLEGVIGGSVQADVHRFLCQDGVGAGLVGEDFGVIGLRNWFWRGLGHRLGEDGKGRVPLRVIRIIRRDSRWVGEARRRILRSRERSAPADKD